MKDIISAFEKTFEDNIFSRQEVREIKKIFEEYILDRRKKNYLRSQIFDLAVNKTDGHDNKLIINWLEKANKIINSETFHNTEDVYFSPGDDCLDAILLNLANAKNTIKICVFTISDNRISNKIIECYKRGIDIKIISDNDKTDDKGSDVIMLSREGLNIRIDNTRHHMHHKFAIIDDHTLITGSYNWTRSAALYNHENIFLSRNKTSISAYNKEFDKLWQEMTKF